MLFASAPPNSVMPTTMTAQRYPPSTFCVTENAKSALRDEGGVRAARERERGAARAGTYLKSAGVMAAVKDCVNSAMPLDVPSDAVPGV